MLNREYQPNDVALDLPASYTYLNLVSACIGALLERVDGLANRKTLTYQIQLAVHETCTNIVEHAYAGQRGRILIVLSYLDDARQLVIHIQDNGASFEFSGYQQPNLGETQESGYGLYLIHQLMDEVDYQPFPEKNQWRLVKHLLS